MAVVERVEREVVVELGVPGASVGVSGLEGGSGMPMRVGVAAISGIRRMFRVYEGRIEDLLWRLQLLMGSRV